MFVPGCVGEPPCLSHPYVGDLRSCAHALGRGAVDEIWRETMGMLVCVCTYVSAHSVVTLPGLGLLHAIVTS